MILNVGNEIPDDVLVAILDEILRPPDMGCMAAVVGVTFAFIVSSACSANKDDGVDEEEETKSTFDVNKADDFDDFVDDNNDDAAADGVGDAFVYL